MTSGSACYFAGKNAPITPLPVGTLVSRKVFDA